MTDTAVEYFPQSINTVRRKRAEFVTIPARHIPEIIRPDGVQVNEKAYRFLPEKFHYLLNPAFISDFALISVPEEHSTVITCSPSSWTRSLTPAYQPVTYGDPPISGSIIQSKGNLYTGRSYMKTIDKDPDRYSNPRYRWGFFKNSRIDDETIVSNKLLENGFPAGLVLGKCVLDGKKLMPLIQELYSKHPALCQEMESSLQKILGEGTDPAILVRMTDSAVRLDNDMSRTILPEILDSFCFFDPQLKGKMNDFLRNPNSDVFIPQELIHELVQSTKIRIRTQANALTKALEDNDFRKTYRHLALSCSAAKDVTARFTSVDFDDSRQFDKHGAEYDDWTPQQLGDLYRDRIL